jgi:hypothetical protein
MRPTRRTGIALLLLTAAGALWTYRDSTQQLARSQALRELAPDFQKLAELRASIFQAYAERARMLERWMGRDEFRRRRFPLPRELSTQDDFDLFEIGQNQISEELAKRLTPQRSRELFAIEEGIARTRAEYQRAARRVLDVLDGVGVGKGGRRPPVFPLDKLAPSPMTPEQ